MDRSRAGIDRRTVSAGAAGTAPILELVAVSKRFGAVLVADQLDLELAAGEALGVIGPNGAGKTSIFNLIAGEARADSGQIRFEGRDITRAAAVPALPARDRPLLPDPAPVRRA